MKYASLIGNACIMALTVAFCGPMLAANQEPAAPQQAPAAALDGPMLFREKGCVHCHGADAAGTAKGPSLKSIGRTWNREKIEHQIRFGGAVMPAFGDVLDDAEVKTLLDFLAQKRAPVKRTRKRAAH
jgi:mono/diheme cytochrome c family protein